MLADSSGKKLCLSHFFCFFPAFGKSVILTGKHPSNLAINGINDATPIADYAPFIIETNSDYFSSNEVYVVDDCDVEGPEIFQLRIIPEGGSIDVSEGSVIIRDNDGKSCKCCAIF